MRKIASLLMVLILLTLIAVTLSFGRRQKLPGIDLSTPYIRYYDYQAQGLVIERADGTDSRIIHNLIDPDANRMILNNWSITGKWFLIRGYRSNGEGGDFRTTNVLVRTDDSKRIDLGEHRLTGLHSAWSPIDDVLLLVSYDIMAQRVQIEIFDPEQDKVFAQVHFEGEITWDINRFQLDWSDDGQQAIVAWHNHVVILERDGRVTTRSQGDRLSDYSTIYGQQRLLFTQHLVVNDRRTLRVEDVITGRFINVEDSNARDIRSPYRIRWNATGSYALLSARPCLDNACSGWLKLLNWETGDISNIDLETVLSSGDARDCYYTHTCSELWSPNGHFAVLTDTNDDVYILETDSATLQPIAFAEGITSYQWLPDNQLLVHYFDDTQLAIYDPVTRSTTPINSNSLEADVVNSPNGDYLAVLSNPPRVITRTAQIIGLTIPHSHSTQAFGFPSSYTWDEDSFWLFANYTISFAGGGGGPSASILFNLEGTLRREFPTGSGANFVPDHVIPYLPAGNEMTHKREPFAVLPHQGRLISVGWHPTNHDQLITYSVEDEGQIWSLATNPPEVIDRFTPDNADTLRREFPIGAMLYWFPDETVVMSNEYPYPVVDTQTGAIVPYDFDYPTLPQNNSDYVYYTQSERQIELSERLVAGRPVHVSSDFQSMVAMGSSVEDGIYHIDLETGIVNTFGMERYLYAADVRDNLMIVGGIYDCCITVWDVASGEQVHKFNATAYSLAISGDGSRLATTATNGVSIWDISEWTQ